MKSLHRLPVLFIFASTAAFSGQVKTKDEAIVLAVEAIQKFHLTKLKDDCGSIAAVEKSSYFEIVVRERHTRLCGGTPDTGPRLFSVRVDKRDGRLTSDVYDGVNYRPVDHQPAQTK
ncbi:hypothetical protein GCM10027277_58450 [Pseudoduganella ginsengisoli]|uniref:Uncharacterized protein n=1 Tax=Pseudoduganella ginsengisoli TaxID=1462440 RepID=A0A6L6Q9I6_9BURK|nr:hypothetical protein [Pseudoduganella ginsengisoli]MTW06139.1 hypothetical protein [Pseudoduganella ginsengisoli]